MNRTSALDERRATDRSAWPDAVLFDCDGTLADTESLSDAAWTDVLRARGYAPTPADFRAVVGHPFARSFAHYSQRVDLGDPERFRAELRERFLGRFDSELEIHHDAVDTLAELSDRGIGVAVVSSSGRASVERVLRHAAVLDRVGAIVAADDVEEHKPAPTPYLAAARALAVDPRRCTAVEDTAVGLAAARAAGAWSVGVLRAHNDAGQLAAADLIVRRVTLDGVLRRV